MMKSGNYRKGSCVVFASALASLFVACAVPGDDGSETAGDPTVSQPQQDPDVSIAPTAPDGATPAGVDQDKESGPLFATAPSISPSTAFEDVLPGGTYTCTPGNFCAGVWNPTNGKWRVFKLFNCARYAVFNWIGTGFYWDNQTGRPQSNVFGSNGAVLNPPGNIFPGNTQPSINWTPVFSIRNC